MITVIVWRRMEGKTPVRFNAKTIVAVCTGVFGALLFGIGMCLTMIFAKMILGIVIGLAGMIVLMMLIPLTKGLK